jgi:hypothetical protein
VTGLFPAFREERRDHSLRDELPVAFKWPALTKHEQLVELG